MKALALAVVLVSTAALADEGESSGGSNAFRSGGGITDASAVNNKQMISGFLFAPWYYGFGVGLGGRYTIPVAPKGFIDTVNDSVEVELGADFWYAGYYAFGYGYSFTALGIPAEARWTFHITDKFDAYGKIGLGIVLGFCSVNGITGCGGAGPYIEAGPGLLYRLGDKVYLRGEIGYTGARIGLGVSL